MKEVSIKDIVVAASGKDALGLAKASIDKHIQRP